MTNVRRKPASLSATFRVRVWGIERLFFSVGRITVQNRREKNEESNSVRLHCLSGSAEMATSSEPKEYTNAPE